jgi:hypothetical protein
LHNVEQCSSLLKWIETTDPSMELKDELGPDSRRGKSVAMAVAK